LIKALNSFTTLDFSPKIFKKKQNNFKINNNKNKNLINNNFIALIIMNILFCNKNTFISIKSKKLKKKKIKSYATIKKFRSWRNKKNKFLILKNIV